MNIGASIMNHPSNHSGRSRFAPFLIALSALLLFSLLAWSAPRTRADSQARAYLPAIMRQLSNGSEAPAATATATIRPIRTPSATATSTATPTITPSPTPTHELAPDCNNLYPIDLNGQLLDNDHFNPPAEADELPYYGFYSDATYTNKTQRRVYMRQFVAPGFAFARWRVSTPDTITALVASLSGAGNITQGFEEAPWPGGVAGKPADYPLRPGQLESSDGDWIYASGASINGDLLAALQYHVENRSLLTLPISSAAAGAGSNLSYHVERLGNVLLRGYGNQSGKGWYLDLVYVGDSTAPACG
jgi:hypothetical protein